MRKELVYITIWKDQPCQFIIISINIIARVYYVVKITKKSYSYAETEENK